MSKDSTYKLTFAAPFHGRSYTIRRQYPGFGYDNEAIDMSYSTFEHAYRAVCPSRTCTCQVYITDQHGNRYDYGPKMLKTDGYILLRSSASA